MSLRQRELRKSYAPCSVAARTQSIKDDLCSAPYRFGDGNALMMAPDGLSDRSLDRSLQLLV